MRVRCVFNILLLFCSFSLLMGTILGAAGAQVILVDDATVTGGAPGGEYDFRKYPWSPAVGGVRPNAGDDYDIEVSGGTTTASSKSSGSVVDFFVLEENEGADLLQMKTSATSGTGSYDVEMENELDVHTLRYSWTGSMDIPRGGPVLNFGSPGSWDDEGVSSPSVIYVDGIFHMWYTGYNGSINRIGYATSEDGIEWVKHESNPVLTPDSGEWDGMGVSDPTVLYDGNEFLMWYTGDNGVEQRIGCANSTDGVNWTKSLLNPVLDGNLPGPLDYDGVSQPSVVLVGTIYYMWYAGLNGSHLEIGYASSTNGYGWNKMSSPVLNPVLDLNHPGTWDDRHVCGPSVIHDGVTYHMWYGGCCGRHTRTGYATSDNGIIWTKYQANPVLDMEPWGTWDDMDSAAPTVLEEGSTYHMWYSGNDGKNFRIGYATSQNRTSWTKLTSPPEVLDAYIITGIEAGLTYTIDLAVPSTADLDMFILSTTGGRDDAIASSIESDTGVDESITFTAPVSGEYVLVITNENGGTGTYTVIGKSPPVVTAVGDLIADENGKVSFEGTAYHPGLTENPEQFPAWAVDISSNGDFLAVGWNRFVTFFNTESSVPMWTLDTLDIIHDLKLSDNGQNLAVLSNKTLYYFDTGSSIPLWSSNLGYAGGLGPGNQLDMTRDGRYVACSARGNRVVVFDSTSGKPTEPYWDYNFGDEVKVLKFSGDGNYLVMGALHSHEFRLAWVPEKSINWTYSNADVFYSASLSYNGGVISFGQGDSHNVGLLASDSSTPVWNCEIDGAQFEQVMSDNGEYLVSSNQYDSRTEAWSGVVLWNTSNSIPLWNYSTGRDRPSKVNTIDMDRDANYVVGGSWNNNIYLFSQLSDNVSGWNLEDGEPVFTYSTEGRIRFNGVTISDNGTYFAVASHDGSVYLFTTLDGPHLVWSWNSSSLAPVPVEYSWDFDANEDSDGDGNFTNDEEATDPDPTHVYDKNGLYTVTLTVTAEDGTSNTYSLQVTVDNFVPRVDAGVNLIVDEGDIVNFAGDITDPGWPEPPAIEWDFGDGDTDSGTLTPTHNYGENGEYFVTLTVTDGDGDMGSDNLMVTVNNVAPIVNAGFDLTADEGDIVSFSGSYTDPSGLDTHTIDWNFGDGSKATGTLTPTHAYGDNGEYTVTLTVTDDDGGIGTDTMTVDVNNVAPSVNAGPDQTTYEDTAIYFNGLITDPGWLDTHTIEWDFGDGGTDSDTLTPAYVYRENGVYEVTLKVKDDDGYIGTDTLIITVNNVKSTTGWINDFFEYGFSLTAAAIIAALLICSFAGGTEVGKYRLIPFISPLYSRLKKEEVLDQFTRGRIYEHIRKKPGDHYNAIKQELGLNNGSIAYHLHTLERENYIKSKRDGIYKRFYPTGMKIPEKPVIRLSEVEKDIIKAIYQNPGAAQKDISKILKISQQVVSYHVNLMIDSGLLRIVRRGKALRYYPVEEFH